MCLKPKPKTHLPEVHASICSLVAERVTWSADEPRSTWARTAAAGFLSGVGLRDTRNRAPFPELLRRGEDKASS